MGWVRGFLCCVALGCGAHPMEDAPLDATPEPEADASETGAEGTCEAPSCAAVGATCGTLTSDCGASVTCGSCAAPETCGGGGVERQCGFAGWEIETVGELTTGRWASLAREASGSLILSFYEPELGVIGLARQDAAWAYEVVDTVGVDLYHTPSRLRIAGDGTVHLVYADGAGELHHVSRRADGGDWSRDTVGRIDNHSDLAFLLVGETPHAWFVSAGALSHAVLGPLGWTVTAIDPGGLMPAVEVTAQGVVHLAYLYRAPGAGGRSIIHRTFTDGVWSDNEELDHFYFGGAPSLALDAAGGVHVLYADEDTFDGDLKYVYRPAGQSDWIGQSLGEMARSEDSALLVMPDGVLFAAVQSLDFEVAYRTTAGDWKRELFDGPISAGTPVLLEGPALLYWDYEADHLLLGTLRTP